MKKAIAIIALCFVFLLIYFLHAHFFSWYNIAGISPNLFIVFILFIGLYLGKNYGFLLGVIFGLMLDFFIGKRIGLYGIELGVAGIIGGILDKSFSKESRLTFMMMTILTTIICESINYALQIIVLGVNIEIINFMNIIFVEIIFNAIIVIILYPLIQKTGNKIEEIFTQRKSLMKYY